MRSPVLRLFPDELIVDNFAGGGGASLGIEWALGRSPDIAINHDLEAIAMHKANHPNTRHYCEDVWKVDPVEACKGRPVGLAWFSPDCKHFSKAKGGKPVEKKIRGLAWIVVKWAKLVKPRVIILENVEEFADWGPLGPDSKPCPLRKGFTFRRWLGCLRNLGYEVDFRELAACDCGAPTTRKRLFLVARRDDLDIVWPEPTHGRGLLPYRTAAECIDFSLPCPSIFDRAKPLAEATQRRIAKGIMRYVIGARQPFIVPLTHQGSDRLQDISAPMCTVTGAHRGEHALVMPELIQIGYGERAGQSPRVPGIDKPLGTVVAGGQKHAVVAAFLAKHYGGHEGPGSPMSEPVATITACDHNALVASHLVKLKGTSRHGQAVTEPLHTIQASGNHYAEVRAFLMKFYGKGGQWQNLREPMHTIPTKDRIALVTVEGHDYAIVDIGMRMLTPRELFRAQGFPDGYIIDPPCNGKPLTKTTQVRMCGNSVSPYHAKAMARAQFEEQVIEVLA